MKATIDFDDQLYRRLKIEAARRGQTIRDLVAAGIRVVLDSPEATAAISTTRDWKPDWLGSLAHHADAVSDHSLHAVRESIARGRSAERPDEEAPRRRDKRPSRRTKS